MRILAFDTALAACSVAVCDHTRTVAFRRAAMERGQAEALMPLIAAAMDEAGFGFAALDRIAVTVGPGSFTGVRVALAAARGLGLALGIPVIGLTTGEVLADGAATAGTVLSFVDSKRGDLYLEAFSPALRPLAPARSVPLDQLAGMLAAETWTQPFTLVGDGASAARAAGVTGSVLADRVLPDPPRLALRAATREPLPGGPLPLYVRAPDVTVS